MTAKIAVDGLFPERARYRTFRKLTDHPLALPQETQWMPQRWDSAFVISSKSKVEHTSLTVKRSFPTTGLCQTIMELSNDDPAQARLAQIVEALARLEEQKTALLNERSALLQQSMAHQAQYQSI